jgi:exosortase A
VGQPIEGSFRPPELNKQPKEAMKNQGVDEGRRMTAKGQALSWQAALCISAGLLAIVIVLYWDTVASAVSLWYYRSSYNHGFLIIPISGYLIWDKRHALAALAPKPSLLGAGVTLGFSLAWLVAHAAGINEGEHFAVVGVIQGVILTVFGTRLFLAMILPMTYLWLMVPTGSFFLPILQQVAHFLSVLMLKLSGIPVFAEGYFVEVPTGTYEVAAGCSGLNFILASLALAPLFGYMMYSSIKKRVIAIAVMLTVAVLANGIRIYGIIALAEFTNRRIDIVDDHLLYGWGFFAAILVIMGFIGSRFADPIGKEPKSPPKPAIVERRNIVVGAALGLLALGFLPLYNIAASSRIQQAGAVQIDVASLGLEVLPERETWRPEFRGADLSARSGVGEGDLRADLYVAAYNYQSIDHELVTFENDLVDKERFRSGGGFVRRIETGGLRMPWRFVRLRSSSGSRLVAYTYQVDGKFIVSPFKAKLYQAKSTLLWGRKDASVVAVSIPVLGSMEEAESDLVQLIEGARLTGLIRLPVDD